MDIVYWRNNLDINLIVLPSLGGEQKDSKLSLGPMPFCRISESFVFVLFSKIYPGPGRPASGMTLAINSANCRHWSGVTDWSGHGGWQWAV